MSNFLARASTSPLLRARDMEWLRQAVADKVLLGRRALLREHDI
jgi:hypothetical protein